MKIELISRQVRILFGVLVGADIFLILANWPLVSNSLLTADPQSSIAPILFLVRKQLDLKAEVNVATWYSSVILLCAGFAAILNGGVKFATGKSIWLYRAGWWIIAALLIGLSADEEAQIHESMAPLLNMMNRNRPERWVTEQAGDWVPLLAPFIVLSAVFLLLFLGTVLWRKKKLLLLALVGIVLWVFAIYFETTESGVTAVQAARDMEGFLEESCEILGTTSLLIAFVSFFRSRQSNAEPARVAGDVRVDPH